MAFFRALLNNPTFKSVHRLLALGVSVVLSRIGAWAHCVSLAIPAQFEQCFRN